MNSLLYMLTPVPVSGVDPGTNTGAWLLIAAIIAFLLLVYLIISLLKPEKF